MLGEWMVSVRCLVRLVRIILDKSVFVKRCDRAEALGWEGWAGLGKQQREEGILEEANGG